MRFLKVVGITSLCVVVMSLLATASPNSLGISEVAHVTFADPIRVGTTLLRPGDYEIRHVMQGEDHIMVLKHLHSKDSEVRVSCKLVPLAQKADRTATVYELNAANEKVLRELVFRGDSAKHVF
ncbi:MAG: hypothetical protein WBW02_14950 [Candidatus Sulfotelmatobacter sp.]